MAVRPGPLSAGAEVPGHEFLLVRSRRRGGWELPGGRAEAGEDPVACALRELWEEAGIRPEAPPVPVQRRTTSLGDGHAFLVRVSSAPSVQRPDEILEARFVARLPARAELSFPDDPYADLFQAVRAAMASPTGPGKGRSAGSSPRRP